MPLQVFDYQDQGAKWLVARDRFGLHDEMGVGKTATTIRAADYLGAERGIVGCPAHLRENWIQEFRKFSGYNRRLCKGQNIHDYYAWKRGKFNILITSYELLTKWAPDIYGTGEVVDFIALDEAHYLKNGDAARTRRLLGPKWDGVDSICEWAEHVWHITGTPMANDPLDIYTFLRLCGVMPLGRETFIKRYFHKRLTQFGARMAPKPEMVSELQQLIQNNSIRRTQKDVGLELPPIFLTESYLDGDTDAVKRMLGEVPGLEKAIRDALEQGGLSFLDSQHVSTLRRLIGEAKALPYAHLLLDELQSGAAYKRVVFGIHRDALITVRDFLWKNNIQCVLINGDTKERDRIEAVNQFQNDDNCRVFLGNMRAAGTGYTLTASCEIDLLESDWSPAGNAQAIKRVHRIGQILGVRARFLTLSRSLDEVVNRVVAQKTAAIATVEGEAMNAAPLDLLAQFI